MPPFEVSRKFMSVLFFILAMLPTSLTEQSRTQNIGNSESLTGNHFEPPKFENVFEAHLAGLRPGLRRAGVHTGGLEPLKNEADWPVIIKRNLMEQTRPEEAVVASGDKESDRQRDEETLVLRTRSAVGDGKAPLELDKFERPLQREMGPSKSVVRADGRVANGRAALLSERRQLSEETALGVGTEGSLTAAEPMSSALASPQKEDQIQLENGPSVSVSDVHSTLIDQYSTPLNWTAKVTGASSAVTMDSTAPAAVQPLGDGSASTFSSMGLPTTSVTLSSQGVLSPLSEAVSTAEIAGSGAVLDMAGVSDAEAGCSDERSGLPLNVASSTETFPLFSNCTERLTSECSRIASLSPESTRYFSEEESGSRLILAKKGRQAFGIMSKGQFLVNDRDSNANVRKFRNRGDSSRMDSNDEESPKDRDQLWENTDINLEFEDSKGNKPLVDELREDKASEMITTQNSPARGEETNYKYNVRNLKSSKRIELDPSEGPIQLTLDPRNGSLTIKTEDSEGCNSTGMQVSMSIGGKKAGIIQTNLPNSVVGHHKPRNIERKRVQDVDVSRKLVNDEQHMLDIKHRNDRKDDANNELRIQKEVKKKEKYNVSEGRNGITELSDNVLEEKPYPQNMLSLALNKGKGEWMDSVRSQQKNRIEPELQGRKNDGIKEMWSEDPVAEVEVNSPTKEGVRIIAPGGQTTVQVKAPESDDDIRKYTTLTPRGSDDGDEKRIDVSSIDADKGQSPDEHTLVVDGIVIKVSGSGRGNSDERPLKRVGAGSNVNLKSYGDIAGRSRSPSRARDNEQTPRNKGTSGKGKDDQFSDRRETVGGNRREKISGNGSNVKRTNKGNKKIVHNTARNEERKKPSNADDSKIGRDETNDSSGSDEWNRWEDPRSSNDGIDIRLSPLKSKNEFKVAKGRNGGVRRETGMRGGFTESFSSGNGKYNVKSLTNSLVDVYQSDKNNRIFTGPDSVTLAFKQDVKPGDVVEPVNLRDIPPNSQESIPSPQENLNKPSDTREAAMRLLMKSRGDKDTLAERTKNLLLKLQPSLASNVPGNLDVVEKGLHALKSASGEHEYHPVMSGASNNDKTVREKQRIFYHRQDIENLVKRADSQGDHELHVSKTHNSQGLGQIVKPQMKEVSQEDSDDQFRENPLDMMEKKGVVPRKIRSSSDEIPIKKRLIKRSDTVIEERRQRSPMQLSEEEREDWEGVDLNSGNNNYYAERAFPAIVNPEDSFVNTESNILGAPFQRQRSEIDAAQLEIQDVALKESPPLLAPHVPAGATDIKGDRDSYMETFKKNHALLPSDNVGPYDSFMGATQMGFEAPGRRPLEAGQSAVLPLPLPFFSVVTMAVAPVATGNMPLRALMVPTDSSNIFTMASSAQTPPGQPVPAPAPASVPPPVAIPAFPSTPLVTQFSVPESVQPSGWTQLSSTPTRMAQPSPEQPSQPLLRSGPPPPPLQPSVPSPMPPSPPPAVASHAPAGAVQPVVQPTLEQASGVVLSEGQPSLPGQHEERRADEPRPAPRPLPPPRPVPPNFSFSSASSSTPLPSTQVSSAPSPSSFPSRIPPSTGINRSKGLAKHTTMDLLPAAAAAVSAAVSLVGLGGDGGAEESSPRGRLAADEPQTPLRGVKKHGRVAGDWQDEQTKKSPATPAEQTWRRLNVMLQNEINTGDLDGNVPNETERNTHETTVDQESATLRELIKLVSSVTNYANGERPAESKREHGGGGGERSGGGDGTAVGDFGDGNSILSSWRKSGSGGDNSGGGGKSGKRKTGKHKADKRSTVMHRLISGISPTSVHPEDNAMPLSSTDSDYLDELGNLEASKIHHKLSHGQLKNDSGPSESLMSAAAGAGQKTELGDATPTGPGEEKRLHGGGGLTAERSLTARLGKIWHAAHFRHLSSTTSDLLGTNMTRKGSNSSGMTSFTDSSTNRVASLSTDHWSADSSALRSHSAQAPTETVDTIASISSTGTSWDSDVTETPVVRGRKGRHRNGVSSVRPISKMPRQETMAGARRKSRRSTNAFVT